MGNVRQAARSPAVPATPAPVRVVSAWMTSERGVFVAAMPFGDYTVEVFIHHRADGQMSLTTEAGPLPTGFSLQEVAVYGSNE